MKDHKRMYGVYLRAGMFSSLVIFLMLFSLVPYKPPKPYELRKEIVTMVEEISAQINLIEEPPPIERPQVAIEAADEVTEAVETIAATEFVENVIRTNPIHPEVEIVPYYKVEVKPQPVTIPRPEYPELVRKAGIEGTAVVKALVDVDGSIVEVKILKSSGNQMLDQEALDVARGAQFTPARQRDKNVRVWVSIPVRFKLSG